MTGPVWRVFRKMVCWAVILAVLPAGTGVAALPGLKRTTVVLISEKQRFTIKAEIADTGESRAKGLMDRSFLPLNEGMLFVFPKPGRYSFWMKNTRIPLVIAFVDDRLRIAAIFEMEPLNEKKRYSPPRPCRYALEIDPLVARRTGLKTGDRIELKGFLYGKE